MWLSLKIGSLLSFFFSYFLLISARTKLNGKIKQTAFFSCAVQNTAMNNNNRNKCGSWQKVKLKNRWKNAHAINETRTTVGIFVSLSFFYKFLETTQWFFLYFAQLFVMRIVCVHLVLSLHFTCSLPPNQTNIWVEKPEATALWVLLCSLVSRYTSK